MQEVIPFMSLMKEVYFIFYMHLPKPEVLWNVFEDNQSCISVTESTKFSPRTKNIVIKYYHLKLCTKKDYQGMLDL